MVSKTGFKWDAVPVDNIKVENLDKESFDIFRREAIRSGRMSKEDLAMSDAELLEFKKITGELKEGNITSATAQFDGKYSGGCEQLFN